MQTHVALARNSHTESTVAEHFYANQFATRATNVLFFNLSVYFCHLFHIQFARQHCHIGKLRIEFQCLDVRYIELCRQVYFHTHLATIHHDGYVADDDSGDIGSLCRIYYLVHSTDILAINNGIHCKIGLYAPFIARFRNLLQVFYGEVISRMRPHIQLPNTEVYRACSCLNGCCETFA